MEPALWWAGDSRFVFRTPFFHHTSWFVPSLAAWSACPTLQDQIGVRLVGWDKRTTLMCGWSEERLSIHRVVGAKRRERRPTRMRAPSEKPRIPSPMLTWRFAAGLQFDVFSPGIPTVLPFSALAASGNAGNSFRGQLRLERFLYPSNDSQWTLHELNRRLHELQPMVCLLKTNCSAAQLFLQPRVATSRIRAPPT